MQKRKKPARLKKQYESGQRLNSNLNELALLDELTDEDNGQVKPQSVDQRNKKIK